MGVINSSSPPGLGSVRSLLLRGALGTELLLRGADNGGALQGVGAQGCPEGVPGVSWGCPGVSSPARSPLYPHSSGADGKETPGPWGRRGPGASTVCGEQGGRMPGLPRQIFAQAVKTEQILLITAHQLLGRRSQHPVCHGHGAGMRGGRTVAAALPAGTGSTGDTQHCASPWHRPCGGSSSTQDPPAAAPKPPVLPTQPGPAWQGLCQPYRARFAPCAQLAIPLTVCNSGTTLIASECYFISSLPLAF